MLISNVMGADSSIPLVIWWFVFCLMHIELNVMFELWLVMVGSHVIMVVILLAIWVDSLGV